MSREDSILVYKCHSSVMSMSYTTVNGVTIIIRAKRIFGSFVSRQRILHFGRLCDSASCDYGCIQDDT